MVDKPKAILDFLEKKYGRGIDRKRLSNQKIYELLVKTILSQRTRDENTEKVAERLFAVARKPKQIMGLSMKRLQSLIRSSGPYRQKAKKIKRATQSMVEDYNGRVPSTRQELVKLYGVGPKTADIVLMYGFNIPSIAVDTHCNRVPKRIGLIEKNASVDEVKDRLEEIFPMRSWYLINHGLVSFGRQVCKPVGPLCIKDKRNCPFSGFCRAFRVRDYSV